MSRLELFHGWEIEGRVQTYIFAETFWQGNIVSPNVLDPDASYFPEMAEAFLIQYLEELERRGNPHVVRQ